MQIEQLESRTLAASIAFTVDAPPIAIVGQTFSVDVMAIDRDRQGVRAVALHASWDAAVLELVAFQVSDGLPSFRGGQVDQSLGRAYDLRGVDFLEGRPVGADGPETAVELVFRAVGRGDATIDIWEGSSGVVPDAITFEGDRVTVLDYCLARVG